MKFFTQYNYSPSAKGMEYPEGVINVVPDQSLTVKEILERFRRGQVPPISHVSEDDLIDDDDFSEDNILLRQNPDLTDLDAIKTRIATLENELKVLQSKKNKKSNPPAEVTPPSAPQVGEQDDEKKPSA